MTDTSPLKFKPDPDFDEARDNAFAVTAAELKQFIEQYERLEAEKGEIMDRQKDVMAEAKGRGYCVRTLKKIASLRRMAADEREAQDAVLELYKTALGM